MDAVALTHTYPYQEIDDYVRLHPESRADVETTVAYFDGINFADRITCPIIVNIGLQDNVCPPETGYTLFERRSEKHTSELQSRSDLVCRLLLEKKKYNIY